MNLQAVGGLPEIRPGDNLAELIAERATLEDGDVLTIASTVVSKAQGRAADLEAFPAGPRATEIAQNLEEITGERKDPRFAQAVLEESTDLLMEAPFLLTETRFGHVAVNAGIDRSNVPGHDLLLLPKRPSESAERIRAGLPADVAVIITDTCGRPFRHGQRGVALGYAGMHASRDWRGEPDRDGRALGVTVESIVDELAAAGNLVAGEGGGGTPAVVIRGVDVDAFEGSDELFRDISSDFIRQALRGWTYQ